MISSVPYFAIEAIDPVVLAEQFDPGIGDDDVEAAPFRGSGIHRSLDISLNRAIRDKDEGLASIGLDLARGFFEGFATTGNQSHPRSFSSKTQGCGATNAGARSCDDGAPPSEAISDNLHDPQPLTTPSAKPLKKSFWAKVKAMMPGVTTIT